MKEFKVDPRWEKLEKELEGIRQQGRRNHAEYLAALKGLPRTGMRASDNRTGRFVPYPVELWTKKELRNRLAFLRKQRGELITKGESLQDNDRKRAKYTRELFERESAANHKIEQEHRNAKRRRKRAADKRKRQKALEDKWFEEKRLKRKALKTLKVGKTEKSS